MVRRDVVTDLERVVECTFDALLAVHIIDDVIATGATWLLRLLLLQVLALGLLVGVRTGLVIAVSVNGCRRMVNRRKLLGALVKEVNIEDVLVVDIVMMMSGWLASSMAV